MRRVRFWHSRAAQDDDLDRELELHLDLAAEDRRQNGIPAGEAARAARKEFGSLALAKEELKEMRKGAALERLLSQAFRDFRYGLRLMARAPGFSVAAVLILALPIAANAAMFSLVDSLLLRPGPGRMDSLVALFSRNRQKPDSYRDFSYPLYVDLRDRSAIFESLTAHTFALVGVRESDTAATKRAFVSIVSSNYFSTLGVQLAAGRPFTLEEERPGTNALVVIASYAAWSRSGFDPAFIGRQMRANGTPFTITGIAPKGLRTGTLISTDWWFPLGTYDRLINELFGAKGLDDRGNLSLFAAGVLTPGVTKAAAAQALDALSSHLAEEFPATDRDRSFVLTSVRRLDPNSRPQLSEAPIGFVAGLLTLTATLVLAVACLNLANLMLARGAARRRELGIRQALGGGRGRIVAQLFMEGLSLSVIGAGAGLILAWWVDRALTRWLGSLAGFVNVGGVDLTVDPSLRMVYVTAALAFFSTLCFALGPAWRLTRSSMTSDLKDEPGVVVRRFGSGAVLVGLQLTISLALLAVGGLFVRSAIEAGGAGPGFALERQLVFSLDPSLAAYGEARTRDLYRNMLQRVKAMAGVEHASLASKVAFGEFIEGGFVRVPNEDTREILAGYTIITSRYFDTLRLPILRGRGFTPEEDERTVGGASAIISEPLADRLYPGGEPLGRQLTLRRGSAEAAGRGNLESFETLTVVGVVPGTTQDILDREPSVQIYVPFGSRFRAAMVLQVRLSASADESAMLASVQRELRRLDEQLPILSARTLTAQRDASVPRWAVRAAASVFGVFGALALLIASLGVYGLEAFEVARRTRELGIRMALGATKADITRLVLRRGARIATIGISLGLLLAVVIGRLVSSVLYRVSPLDLAALSASVVVLGAATLLACYIPARRATRIATLRALRTE